MTDPTPQRDAGSPAPAVPLRRGGRPELSVRTTHQLEDLERMVQNAIQVAFPHRIWVAGLVADVGPGSGTDGDTDGDRAGEGPLELVLSAGPDGVLTLDSVIAAEQRRELAGLLDRDFDADLEDLVARGRWLRAGGLLRYSFAEQRLDFTVSALDPGPTEAALAADREAVRRRVHDDGLPGRQRSLPTPAAPLRVAVVAPSGSDTGDQVVDRLRASGYALRLRLLPVDLRDRDAAGHLAATLTGAAVDTDLVLLVRRNGRPLGLGPYDTEVVARAIARSPVPVVTGLGGPEASVADDVAADGAPTALAAADLVVARLDAAADRLRGGAADVTAAADLALGRAAAALSQLLGQVRAAGGAAAERADAAERRRMRWLLSAAAAVALLLVATAVITGRPAVLAGLIVVLALVLAFRQQRTRYRNRGSRPMRVPDLGFAGVLERLERIRQELVATSSPERVHELRAEADALVARGEQILGRPAGSPPAPGAPEPGASEPGAAEPSPPEAPAPDPRAADREAADPGAAHPDGAAPADPATRPLPGRRPADGEQTAVLTRS